MIVAGMPTGNIGIQAFDLVGEPRFLKEVERPVYGRRLGRALAIEIGQQVIGLGRGRAFQQQAEDFAADARHALAPSHNKGFRFIQESVHILRAAGRIGVDVTMCLGHVCNVVCFAANVKASVPSFAGQAP